MCASLLGVIIFNLLGYSLGVLVMLISLIVFFQSTIGAIFWIHTQETCIDSAIGIVNTNFQSWNVIARLAGPYISKVYGTNTLFTIFAVGTFLGCIYIKVFVRDTTYTWVDLVSTKSTTSAGSEAPKIILKRPMSIKEKSEVYMPIKYRYTM